MNTDLYPKQIEVVESDSEEELNDWIDIDDSFNKGKDKQENGEIENNEKEENEV